MRALTPPERVLLTATGFTLVLKARDEGDQRPVWADRDGNTYTSGYAALCAANAIADGRPA